MEDDDGGFVSCFKACCNCCLLLVIVLVAVLVPAFGVVYPVRATVADASLRSFALNGTALSYDLQLTVGLRNRNWAMQAQHSGPMDAELRFAGRPIAGGRVTGAGRDMDPRSREAFPMLAASAEGVEIDGDAAAEFARQSVRGVFELELKLNGEFRYKPVHIGRSRRMDVTCPLKMVVESSPAHAAPGTWFMVPVFDKVVRCCY